MASILFVSDNLLLADAYAFGLSDIGHSVEIAPTASAAQDRLASPDVDLVIVDVASLEGCCGLLIEQARAAWGETRVLALTKARALYGGNLGQMDLWAPDRAMVHPVGVPALVAAAERLLIRGERTVRPTHRALANDVCRATG